MSEFNLEISAAVVAACKTNSAEVGSALGRALDAAIEVVPGAADRLDESRLSRDFDGPGLVVVFTFGGIGALALIPESTGLLPPWYAAPGPTEHAKLETMAQELSMLLVPEEFLADSFRAGRVANLRLALARCEPAEKSGVAPLELNSAEKTGTMSFIWPIARPDAALDDQAESTAPQSAPTGEFAGSDPFGRLPSYTRSMLRIEVPVMVSLASTRQKVSEILDLGVGSIIKFAKSCDEPLELEVGGYPVARGEAVKVGDKFGLRIQSMILPGERFHNLAEQAGAAAR